MKIYFLNQESLDTLKINIDHNLKKYTHKNNDWIIEYFDGKSPFLEFKKEAESINLNGVFQNESVWDFESIKKIYEGLKFLDETEASDERLWSGLAHSVFWEYMQKRWMTEKGNITVQDIKNKFFYSHGVKRSGIVHPIAKLWWIGKYTYDETRQNRYELTEYFSRDLSLGLSLFSNNYSSNPMITRAFLGACIAAEHEEIKVSREIFREISKYVNLLGGMYILDALEQDELQKKITERIKVLSLTDAV